jgi:hypothetical protein
VTHPDPLLALACAAVARAAECEAAAVEAAAFAREALAAGERLGEALVRQRGLTDGALRLAAYWRRRALCAEAGEAGQRDMSRKLADRVFAAHEVLGRLAERRERRRA